MQGDLVTTQLTVAMVVSYGLERLKQWQRIPWVTQETAKLNRILAAGAAAAAAVGIHASFSQEAGVLTITGLTLAGIAHFGWQWLSSFVFQELTYRVAIKNGGVRAATGTFNVGVAPQLPSAQGGPTQK